MVSQHTAREALKIITPVAKRPLYAALDESVTVIGNGLNMGIILLVGLNPGTVFPGSMFTGYPYAG